VTDIRVAIIDEHGIVRRGLREVFNRSADVIVVGEAADVSEAIAVVVASQPDVVVVDLAMDTRECELVGEILLAASTAVLVFCEHADARDIEVAIAAGASGFLLKTAKPAEILLAIDALHDGHIYLQPQITRAFLARLTGRAGEAGVVPVSRREMEILQLIANGMSTDEAATALDRSPATVKSHVRSVFKKLGAKHRAHAVAEALRLNLIQ